MKKSVLCSFTIMIFIGIGCSNSIIKSTDNKFGSEIKADNTAKTLDTYLKRLSGIRVNGSGPNATVRLRGSESIQLDTSPLYVLNGVRIGKDFRTVYYMVNMSNLVSVKVLRSSRATIKYGNDAGFGAIEIVTTDGDTDTQAN